MVSHCGLELEAVPQNTEKRSVCKDQSRKGTARFLVKLVSRESPPSYIFLLAFDSSNSFNKLNTWRRKPEGPHLSPILAGERLSEKKTESHSFVSLFFRDDFQDTVVPLVNTSSWRQILFKSQWRSNICFISIIKCQSPQIQMWKNIHYKNACFREAHYASAGQTWTQLQQVNQNPNTFYEKSLKIVGGGDKSKSERKDGRDLMPGSVPVEVALEWRLEVGAGSPWLRGTGTVRTSRKSCMWQLCIKEQGCPQGESEKTRWTQLAKYPEVRPCWTTWAYDRKQSKWVGKHLVLFLVETHSVFSN